jgi:mono/diheme cytochrome c family protein
MFTRMMMVAATALIVLASSGSIARAADEDPAAIYKEHCAKCHGDTGRGDTPSGKMLKAPDLVGNAKVTGVSVPDLVKAIQANDKHKAPLKKLSEAQITAGATRAKALAEAK